MQTNKLREKSEISNYKKHFLEKFVKYENKFCQIKISCYFCILFDWRGARVVEWDGLENR